MTGTVKTLRAEKNFGFVKTDKADYFFHKQDCDFHWNDMVEDFEKGIEIQLEFEPTRTDKGLRAEEVRWLNSTGV